MANDLFRLTGTLIAEKFRVERALGEGGFGVVYAGRHLLLDIPVAIKCLKPFGATPDEQAHAAQAFLREARILFTLQHAAIVRLYDVGMLPGSNVPYAVLELLSGRTLEQEIAERRAGGRHFSARELIDTFSPILDGLAFAHERGVIHRDIKPANIMLSFGQGGASEPKLLDFGTAREGAFAQPSQHSGFTPRYAAPEQWDRTLGPTAPYTDVFAIAMTLAEACLLAPPVDPQGGMLQLFAAALDERRRPALRVARPDLPPALSDLVDRALRVNPRERFASGRELAAAFHAALSPAAGAPVPSAVPPPPLVPQMMSGAPPLGVSTTTTPHALRSLPPAPAGRSPATIIALGLAGLSVLIAAVSLVALVVFLLRPEPAAEASAATPTAAKPKPTAVPSSDDLPPGAGGAAGASTGEIPIVPATPPAPQGGPGGGTLRLAGVLGAPPTWTKGDVLETAAPSAAAFNQCAAATHRAFKGATGSVSVIVAARLAGDVESTMCSLTEEGESGAEAVVCPCVERVIARWRLPKARGRVGALQTGTFILDLKLTP
jgi:eukaryotic-like serine/threonine-protein kinase